MPDRLAHWGCVHRDIGEMDPHRNVAPLDPHISAPAVTDKISATALTDDSSNRQGTFRTETRQCESVKPNWTDTIYGEPHFCRVGRVPKHMVLLPVPVLYMRLGGETRGNKESGYR